MKGKSSIEIKKPHNPSLNRIKQYSVWVIEIVLNKLIEKGSTRISK